MDTVRRDASATPHGVCAAESFYWGERRTRAAPAQADLTAPRKPLRAPALAPRLPNTTTTTITTRPLAPPHDAAPPRRRARPRRLRWVQGLRGRERAAAVRARRLRGLGCDDCPQEAAEVGHGHDDLRRHGQHNPDRDVLGAVGPPARHVRADQAHGLRAGRDLPAPSRAVPVVLQRRPRRRRHGPVPEGQGVAGVPRRVHGERARVVRRRAVGGRRAGRDRADRCDGGVDRTEDVQPRHLHPVGGALVRIQH